MTDLINDVKVKDSDQQLQVSVMRIREIVKDCVRLWRNKEEQMPAKYVLQQQFVAS